MNITQCGDDYSKHFYQSLKISTAKITLIKLSHAPDEMVTGLIRVNQHFNDFINILGVSLTNKTLIHHQYISHGYIFSAASHSILSLHFITKDIKNILRSILHDKYPGMDNFSNKVFELSSSLVRKIFCKNGMLPL